MNYPTEFLVTENECGWKLIIPNHESNNRNDIWNRQTIWYRSRVVDANGTLLSQGFGKFWNLDSGPAEFNVTTRDVIRACEEGDAIATLKEDGSLIIRSVTKDSIIIRTRGSFGYANMDNVQEMEQLLDKYLKLYDPKLYTGYSLLFEWRSPTNQIVIRHTEPELVLIGAVDHTNMVYATMAELTDIAKTIGMPLVEHFKLDTQGWEKLYTELQSNTQIEGYVIRINGEQSLVKVKTPDYIKKHAFKSDLNISRLVDLWLIQQKPSFQDFCENIRLSFDDEILMYAMPLVSKMFDAIRQYKQQLDHLEMKAFALIKANVSRKDYAIEMKAQYGDTKLFSLAMCLFTGKEIDNKIVSALIMQKVK